MDRIDALGHRPDRYGAFTHELLAEADDVELQEIVRQAAAELSTPIALVSLVLDQVQYFKASVGLPPELAAARGTHRDVSFCQFIVRDGQSFEVNDASNDPRIPKQVAKDYDIQSYLGVPIRVKDTVVGSLCVLDIEKRKFSESHRNSLNKLARLVNERLEVLTRTRRQRRLDLTERAIQPGLSELSQALKPIPHQVHAGYSAMAAMRSFLDLTKHIMEEKRPFSDAFLLSYEAAVEANKQIEELLFDIEAAAADSQDCVDALEGLTSNVGSLSLSEVVIAGQDLARHATKSIGGCPLPEFDTDPIIYSNGTMAIAIVTNCILAMAAALGERGSQKGIEIKINDRPGATELLFSAEDLSLSASEAVVQQLILQLGKDPSVFIDSAEGDIKLTFKTRVPNT